MAIDNIYDNLEEAQFRLAGTVVTYDSKPCYVQNVEEHRDGIIRLQIVPLPHNVGRGVRENRDDIDEDSNLFPAGALIRKKINSPKFNRFRTMPLGYMNYFDNGRNGARVTMAHYVERIPVRRSKQGLSQEGCRMKTVTEQMQVTFAGMIASQAFYEMAIGEYPSYEEAYQRLVTGSCIAVTRDFAVYRDQDGFPYLLHQNKKIGICSRDTVTLGRNFQYMREEIVETECLPRNVAVF